MKMGKKRKISTLDSKNVPEKEYFVEIDDIIKTYSKEVLVKSSNIEKIHKKSTECRPKVQKTESSTKHDSVTARQEPEIVVFKSRKRNIVKKDEKSQEKGELLGGNSTEEMNSKDILEKLKFDVGSFGLKGFSKEEQRRLEKQRAIKLGAKPEKREYVNYKVLMKNRKQEKAEESLPKKKEKSKEDKKAKSGSFWSESKEVVGGFKPQIGKFKNGVLTLSAKDIKSVRRKT